MARRSTPERINDARRIALRKRLIDEDRMRPDVAESWITAWEGEALLLGIAPGSEYWTMGSAWIEEHRERRRSA